MLGTWFKKKNCLLLYYKNPKTLEREKKQYTKESRKHEGILELTII